jgi:hypothetical protein
MAIEERSTSVNYYLKTQQPFDKGEDEVEKRSISASFQP